MCVKKRQRRNLKKFYLSLCEVMDTQPGLAVKYISGIKVKWRPKKVVLVTPSRGKSQKQCGLWGQATLKFKSPLFYLLALSPWIGYLIYLSFGVLICKNRNNNTYLAWCLWGLNEISVSLWFLTHRAHCILAPFPLGI